MAEKPETAIMTIVPILIGALLFIVLVLKYMPEESTQFDQLALGQETKGYMATYLGVPVQCHGLSDAGPCLDGWRHRGERPVILWLGNSQLYSINQLKAGDVTASELLFNRLNLYGTDLLTFSQPNANLQEHYLLFEYLKRLLPVRVLVLPVVFDDTREDGLRESFLPALSEHGIADELSETWIGQAMLAENKKLEADKDMAGLNDTPQKIVESFLSNWLAEHWALWKGRPEMRGHVLTNLYLWRNSILGIDAQSKRKLIPGRYEKNMAALEATLQSCVAERIRVILYIVPLRNDVDTPYIAREYVGFKKDVEQLADKYDAAFANLEGLVPGALWGIKNSTSVAGGAELDFMHFQAGGHRLLADAMFGLLQRNRFLGNKR